ncbi:MAG: hypothetical protein NTX25_23335 [Proteobacteria bacterium]|nr:hypothetical protein [Pseudomonadota bacterium]
MEKTDVLSEKIIPFEYARIYITSDLKTRGCLDFMREGHLFLVTGAIKSNNTLFTASQRATQTIATLKSIKRRYPQVPIVYIDAGIGGSRSLFLNLKLLYIRISVKKFLDISKEPAVLEVQKNFGLASDLSDYSVGRLGLYKSILEVLSYQSGIKYILNSKFSNSKSITKISARYVLNLDYDLNDHLELLETYDFLTSCNLETYLLDKIRNPLYCQSVLWSGNIEKVSDLVLSIRKELDTAAISGMVLDLEHALFSSLRGSRVHELRKLGVEGNASMTNERIEF